MVNEDEYKKPRSDAVDPHELLFLCLRCYVVAVL